MKIYSEVLIEAVCKRLAWGLWLWICLLTLAWAGDSEPQTNTDQVVQVGIHVRGLTAVDEVARTFDANFGLWLRYTGDFSPAGLIFLDATKPVELGTPIDSLDHGAKHYRLYRVQTTFRYKIDQEDLLQKRRRLLIRFTIGNQEGGNLLFQLDHEGMGVPAGSELAWLQQLRMDEVLVGLKGWSLDNANLTVANPLHRALGEPRYPTMLRERPTIVATLLVTPPAYFSPKAILAAVLPIPASPMVELLALTFLCGTWIALRYRWEERARVVAKLLMGTLAFYFTEPLLVSVAIGWLSPDAMELLLTAFGCAWWLVPAVWFQAILPPFIWTPLNRRTGNPVPVITRTMVPIVAYLFAGLLTMYFTLGHSLTAVGTASGVLTVVLGLALQNLILDAFAGILLNLERPFKVLHWIKIGGQGWQQEGQVIDMNWRATRLLTRTNDVVCVPNSQITRSTITNYAMPSAPSLVGFSLMLDETVPIKLARKLIREGVLEAAKEYGRVLAEPQPSVTLESSKEHGLRYQVWFYTNFSLVSGGRAITDALEGAIERLAQEGIPLANPRSPVVLPGYRELAGPEQFISMTKTVTPPTETPPKPRAGPEKGEEEGLPITPGQIRLVQESWSKVVPIAETAATLFYNRLFELNPAVKPLFRTDAKTQQRKLIGMLGLIVKGLGRLDDLVPMLQELGLKHVTYGVQDPYYDSVGEALLWTLEKGLGDQFTIEVKAAWVRAYSLVAETMKVAK